jgi:hypothetical protein
MYPDPLRSRSQTGKLTGHASSGCRSLLPAGGAPVDPNVSELLALYRDLPDTLRAKLVSIAEAVAGAFGRSASVPRYGDFADPYSWRCVAPTPRPVSNFFSSSP